jgi:hypothetical protein
MGPQTIPASRRTTDMLSAVQSTIRWFRKRIGLRDDVGISRTRRKGVSCRSSCGIARYLLFSCENESIDRPWKHEGSG